MSHVWSKCNRTRTVILLKQNRDTYPNGSADWNGATHWYLGVLKKSKFDGAPHRETALIGTRLCIESVPYVIR